MSADIHILPVVHVDRQHGDETSQAVRLVQVRLPQHYWRRLAKLAAEWNTTEQEAAEMLLAEILNGRR